MDLGLQRPPMGFCRGFQTLKHFVIKVSQQQVCHITSVVSE